MHFYGWPFGRKRYRLSFRSDPNGFSKEFATMHALLRSLRLGTATNLPRVFGAKSASLPKFFTSLAVVTTLAAVSAVAAQADAGVPPWGPAPPNFTLQVIRRPAGGPTDGGFGLVKF